MAQDRVADIDIIKNEIDQYRPLPKFFMPMLKEYFRIGLTYSSNALEGNTLTEIETKVILEDGIAIGGKRIKEHLEVIGHGQAYDFMWHQAHNAELSEYDITELHRLLIMRSAYISAIQKGNKGNVTPFLDFISEMVYESSKEYLRLIKSVI